LWYHADGWNVDMPIIIDYNDIIAEIKGLSKKEVAERVRDILAVKVNPTMRYSSSGVGYISPIDILGSKAGKETIDRFREEAEERTKVIESSDGFSKERPNKGFSRNAT
jgi:hypothetical protein